MAGRFTVMLTASLN